MNVSEKTAKFHFYFLIFVNTENDLVLKFIANSK
jgi:hypothetical protein